MTIFLILAPYGAFATLMLVTSAATSLFVAAAICLMVIALRRRSRPLDQDAWRGLGDPVHRARLLHHAGRSRLEPARR